MRLFYLFFGLFSVLAFNGCIDDDSEDCPTDIENNFVIKFRYVSNESGELFIKKIKKVD